MRLLAHEARGDQQRAKRRQQRDRDGPPRGAIESECICYLDSSLGAYAQASAQAPHAAPPEAMFCKGIPK
jgi:hypothetical protein